ncbi:MAG: hypothetical protein ACRER4_02420 [Steroidobacteraceae bacterium]
MSVNRIGLDFQRRLGRTLLGGPLLLAAGIVMSAILVFAYRQTVNEIAGIELQLAGLQPSHASDSGPSPSIAMARATVEHLGTPWGKLLDDLEAASGDSDGSVALLEVEPDREHGKIRVLAEARSLVAALGYLERLQKAGTLANPLLQSHEIRKDVPERPVRVQIMADWRVTT